MSRNSVPVVDAKVHNRVNNIPQLVSILRQMSHVHTLPLQFLNIYFVLSCALIGLGSGLFSLSFPFKTHFSSFLHTPLISRIFGLVIVTISGQEYKI